MPPELFNPDMLERTGYALNKHELETVIDFGRNISFSNYSEEELALLSKAVHTQIKLFNEMKKLRI